MSDTPGGNPEQAEYWEARAASWIEAEDFTSLVTGPFGQLAMERLVPAPGEAVLDVGCGTGPTTVELARRVLPGGRVVGLDISASMLEVARARAAADGQDHATFVVADAQTEDLGAGSYDAVFSRFGVMFFADPIAAFTNLRRSLRDGGRIAFACWQDVMSNEWMFVPGSAVVTVTGELPPMPAPGAPGPFSLSDAADVERVLAGAGFSQVEVAPRTAQIVVAADRLDLIVESATKVGAVRMALESIDDPAVADRIVGAVRDALAERVQDGELRLGSAAFVVSAVNAG